METDLAVNQADYIYNKCRSNRTDEQIDTPALILRSGAFLVGDMSCVLSTAKGKVFNDSLD